MSKNTIINILAAQLFLICGLANAGIITIGTLTLESAGDTFVTDHVNNVDYLRWDQVREMNYAEITAAVQAGGLYEGWTIATNIEANNFVNALLGGVSMCDSVFGNSNSCGTGTTYDINMFTKMMGWAYDNVVACECETHAWFRNTISANGVGVGVMGTWYSVFGKQNYWGSFAVADSFAHDGLAPGFGIGYALVRNGLVRTNVPEPSTFAIFALGMIGLASRRLKKQS